MRSAFRAWNWSRPLSNWSMNIKRASCTFFLGLFVFAGSACGKQKGTVLGQPPKGEPQTMLAVRDGITPPNVTLRGLILEKCPTAGCWFLISDRTGALKVDTKNAGFVVAKIPLQTEVTVSGKIVYEGSEPVLEATGLRY
jgi:uncharacterized protein YdeI (BOF family)